LIGETVNENVDQPAVFLAADGLVVLDAIAGTEARKDRRFFVDVVGRNQYGYRLADYLLAV
jgi:hypothetical protein